MRNIIDIMSIATGSSLVLLDEIGSSTDPEEGAALARAILDRMAEKGTPTIVTTHHRSVAAHAEAHERMMNGSVDLDPATLAPTYRLTLGMPGNSYAMTVAANLGLEAGVMEAAESMLDPGFRAVQRLADGSRRGTALASGLRSRNRSAPVPERRRSAASTMPGSRRSNPRGRDIEESIRNEVSERYRDVRRRLRRVEAALSWTPPDVPLRAARSRVSGPTAGGTRKAADELTEIKQQIDSAKDPQPAPAPADAEILTLEVGRTAEVRGLGLRGKVERLYSDTGEAEVVIGNLRMRLDARKLLALPDQPAHGRRQRPCHCFPWGSLTNVMRLRRATWTSAGPAWSRHCSKWTASWSVLRQTVWTQSESFTARHWRSTQRRP